MALIGIFSRSLGPSLAVRADPVRFSFLAPGEPGSERAGFTLYVVTIIEIYNVKPGVQVPFAALYGQRVGVLAQVQCPHAAHQGPQVKFKGSTQNSQVDPEV
jgi:hypothetical protein